MKWTALLLGTLASACAFAEVKVDPARIVVVDCGYPRQQEELKRHLDLLTGRSVPIVKFAAFKKPQFGFFLGRKPSKSFVEKLEAEEIEEDEGASGASCAARNAPPNRGESSAPGCCAWEVTKDGVNLWGDVRRGLYRMLAQEFGFEWPWSDAVWVSPQTETVVLPHTRGEWTPPFALRNVRSRKSETFALWSERLGGGKNDPPPEGHAFTSWWFRFCDDHPECFGMRPDGVRAPYGVSTNDIKNALKVPKKQAERVPLCTSCEKLVDCIISEWRAAGAGRDLNICENDARPWEYCRCAGCLALDGVAVTNFGGFAVGPDTWPGWRSDRYVHLARCVLEKAVAENPFVRGGTYAYNAGELPPQRETVPTNLVVGLVPTHFTKEYVTALVDGWKKAGMKSFYYRPNVRYYWRVPFVPMGYERYLFEVQKLLHERGGLLGFDYDSPLTASIFEYVQNWFLYQFMADPTKDFDHWNARLCRCFGPAASDVDRYFAFWRAKWDRVVAPLLPKIDGVGFNGAFNARLGKLYAEEEWTRSGALLDAGLAREGLSVIERKLLQTLRDEHEQSRLSYRAWTLRTKEAVQALIDFRRTHDRATIWGFEEKAFSGLLPESP